MTFLCCSLLVDLPPASRYKDKRLSVSVPPVLGILPVPERCLLPQQIEHPFFNIRIVSVHCGWDHSMAVTETGKLYTWGAGYHGKLGHGNSEAVAVPQLVQGLKGYVVVGVNVCVDKTLCHRSIVQLNPGRHGVCCVPQL